MVLSAQELINNVSPDRWEMPGGAATRRRYDLRGRETEALSVRESEAERKECEHEKDLERLKLLRPMDDDFMRGMLKDNVPLAEFMVRIILDKPDFRFIRFETQADLKQVTGERSVIFDGLGTEDSGRKIDLEVQRTDKGVEPERARYYSSMLDIENLESGQDFSELPDACVIFITEKDFYGDRKPIYHIERMNITTGEPFNDRSLILYVNGEYEGDDDLGYLMHDFRCTDPDKMHYGQMADRARYLKESSEGVSQMCKIMEDMRDEARAEGRAEGVSEGEKNNSIKIAIRMIANNESDVKIQDYTDLSPEDIQALRSGQTVTA